MTKRVLLTALILFIIFDLVLFFYFINKPKKAEVNNTSPTKSTLSYQKKFTSVDQDYNLMPGEFKTIIGDPRYFLPDTISVQAYIVGSPSTDNKDKLITLPVVFISKNGKELAGQLILGKSESDQIQVSFAKGGNIPSVTNWELKKILEINTNFSVGNPIIARVYIQYPPEEFFENPKCDEKCRSKMNFVRNFTDNSTLLTKALSEEKYWISNTKIGPPDALIIYAN